jgi:hypothetical protein
MQQRTPIIVHCWTGYTMLGNDKIIGSEIKQIANVTSAMSIIVLSPVDTVL